MSKREIDIERVRSQVKEFRKTTGPKRSRLPRAIREDVIALVDSGMPVGEVSRATGVAHSSIGGWITSAKGKKIVRSIYATPRRETLSPTVVSVVPEIDNSSQDCRQHHASRDDCMETKKGTRFGFCLITGQRSIEFLFLVRRC
jgi:hypothetical protein